MIPFSNASAPQPQQSAAPWWGPSRSAALTRVLAVLDRVLVGVVGPVDAGPRTVGHRPHRVHDILTPGGQHVPSLTAGRDGDKEDDRDGQSEAKEHAENERSHDVKGLRDHAEYPIDTRQWGTIRREWPASPTLRSVTDDAPPAAESAPRRRRLPVGVEILIALVVVALVQAVLIKPFGVPSQSMENTLQIGDRILVNRLPHTVTSQEVIVFGHGDTWAQARKSPSPNAIKQFVRTVGDFSGIGPSNTAYTVKRVIGLPGQRVACCTEKGEVTVDDTPLVEPYVYEDLPFTPGTQDCTTTPASPRCFGEITVPADNLLVLGDHRSQSADSVMSCRGSTEAVTGCATFVPTGRVIGPVVFRLWPLRTAGGIPAP